MKKYIRISDSVYWESYFHCEFEKVESGLGSRKWNMGTRIQINIENIEEKCGDDQQNNSEDCDDKVHKICSFKASQASMHTIARATIKSRQKYVEKWQGEDSVQEKPVNT
jgi:hypothetical protein